MSVEFNPTYALTVGGESAGYVKSIDGLHTEAKTAEMAHSSSNATTKTSVGLEYPPLQFSIAMGMGGQMIRWIMDTLDEVGNAEDDYRDGSVVIGDQKGAPMEHIDFQRALLAEIGFPALSAESNDITYLDIKIDPTRRIETATRGGKLQTEIDDSAMRFTNRMFRFLLHNGLDGAQTTKVEGFKITQEITKTCYGHDPEPQKSPGNVKIPDLTATMAIHPEAYNRWKYWADGYFKDGNRFGRMEASLVYLDSARAAIAEVKFKRLSPKSWKLGKLEKGKNAWTFTFSWAVEEVELDMGGAAFGIGAMGANPVRDLI
jgi:hypothetical protein